MLKTATFDIETWDLGAEFGPLVCASVLLLPENKMVTFRQDSYVRRHKAVDMTDDRALLCDLRDLLNTRHLTAGWHCHDPNHRVLTADLRWVCAGDLKIGDKLLSLDETVEKGRTRKWRTGTVTYHKIAPLPCYRIVLSNGEELIASGEHPWLAHKANLQFKWIPTKRLVPGKSRLKRLLPVWEHEQTYDAGWLAGFIDGEGHLGQVNKARSSADFGCQLAITQREGRQTERAARLLKERGFLFSVRAYDTAQPHMRQILLNGGRSEVLRLLGTVRPERLIDNLRVDCLGTVGSHQDTSYVTQRVEKAGPRPVVMMSVDCGTYLTEGYGSHNSKGFDVPHVNTRLALHGETMLQKKLHLDARWQFSGWRGLKTKTAKLKHVSEFFGFEEKPEVPPEVWLKARGGNKKAIDEVVERCEADVRITAQITEKALDLGLVRHIESYP